MNERKKQAIDTEETLSLGDTQNTGQSPMTMEDYKSHVRGFREGVAGHPQDEKGTHQYRIGFKIGRDTMKEYAKTLKKRVAQ